MRQPGRSIIKSVSQKLAGPNTIMQDGDIIYVIGEREQALRLAADYSLDIPSKAVSDGYAEHESLDFMTLALLR